MTTTGQLHTLPQKIAQMLMIGFRGTALMGREPVVRDIQQYGVGGVVLFDYDVLLQCYGRNITCPPQVSRLCASLQSYSRTPLLIAVDQEGGRVARLKERYGFAPTVSARALGEINDLEHTRRYAGALAATLAAHGLNLNFAPVVDLNVNPDNPIIGKLDRCFGTDPDRVVRHAGAVVEAHQEHHLAACLKHFPGHGSSSADSHLGFVDVSDSWTPIELEPYRRLIAANRSPMIMTAHIYNRHLDPRHPATLSESVINGLLRRDLGYDGVVITDDLQMGAIARTCSYARAVRLALLAGADMILVANNMDWNPGVVPQTIALIEDLVAEGTLSEERIDRSWRRIMSLKAGLITRHPNRIHSHRLDPVASSAKATPFRPTRPA